MLGRLRAPYECFKITALSFPKSKTVESKLVGSSYKQDIKGTRFCKQLRSLAESISLKRLIESKNAQKCLSASWLHVYLEMQILVHLESLPEWRQSVHPYIGTGKRPCFLCHELLQNYVRLSANSIRSQLFELECRMGRYIRCGRCQPSRLLQSLALVFP
jgi:hypothetical protein